ncbi:hypothetical protein TWF506_000420 [Arthrobotrys conoides]|uniref:Uncharacterized protein n=1 Tax=Arthrobotrys conoides TaxID=74498 RepID=A0AAN8NLE4_9PEZI
MSFTPSGTQFIKAAYNYKSLRSYRLSTDSQLLLENLEKQWKVFPGPIDSLQPLFNEDPQKSAWRSEDHYELYLDYKVYKIWEALYAESEIFKNIIDQEEASARDYIKYNYPGVDAMQNQDLWKWLQHLFVGGMLAREDVEHLPDPKPNLGVKTS